MRPGGEWRHAPEAWAEIWEKAVSWVPASEEEDWLSELSETRRLCALGRRALVGLRADDVKAVSIERVRLSLSSCRKTFKLKKVNKSCLPEPIS